MMFTPPRINRHRRPQNHHGFSAFEPLAGVFSLLFVTLLGQPLYVLLNDRGPEHLLQEVSLASHLEYARQEAIRLKTTVTVCPSEDGRNCLLQGEWKNGWIVFTDETEPFHHLSVGDKFLHRQHGSVTHQPRLVFDMVQYQADGSLHLN
jgi:hypothetical protein